MIAKQQALSPALVPLATFFVVMAAALGFLTLQGKEVFGLFGLLAVLGATVIALRPDLGILIFMATLFVTYKKFLPIEGKFTPNNLLGLFFAVLLLVKVYREKDVWFFKEKTLQIFALLLMLFIFSPALAEQRFGSSIAELDLTKQSVQSLVTRFVFLIFFVNFIRSLRDLNLVLCTLIGLILLTAFSGAQASMEGMTPGGYRAAAKMGIHAAGNANRLAFLCVAGIAIVWYYRRTLRGGVLWLLLSAAIPGLALTALLTGSRSGLLNLGILFGLIAMEGRFSIKRQIQTALAIILAAYLGGYFLTSSHIERLENLSPGAASTGVKGTGSIEKRLRTIQDGLGMVVENPIFGVGIGNFRWVRLQQTGTPGPPHNSYLWALTEGGIPILLLYLMLYGISLRNLLRVEGKARDPRLVAIARGVRTALLTFLVFSFFADFWLNIFMYLLIGLSIVLRRIQENEPRVVFRGEFNPAIRAPTGRTRTQVLPA
jgi:O-antigen ligase